MLPDHRPLEGFFLYGRGGDVCDASWRERRGGESVSEVGRGGHGVRFNS